MPDGANINVDLSGFNAAMKQYATLRNKSDKEILQDQTQKLVSNGFKGGGGLYQEARTHAPETIADIKGLRARLGWRIRTWRFARQGLSKEAQIEKEIARRLKLAGYFQSTGWLNRRYKGKAKVDTRAVKNPRGRVREKLHGDDQYIEITNITPGAAKFAEKTGYVQRALNNRAKDMMIYVTAKLAGLSQKCFG